MLKISWKLNVMFQLLNKRYNYLKLKHNQKHKINRIYKI